MRDDTKNGCVADWHYRGDMAVRMCEVPARLWVGVFLPLALPLYYLWIVFLRRSV